MFAIISGLDHKTVQRLQGSWERVPEKYKKLFDVREQSVDLNINQSEERETPDWKTMEIENSDQMQIDERNTISILGVEILVGLVTEHVRVPKLTEE